MEAKIVFITGASSGIGEGCARKFAKEGWNLILNARTVSKLEELKAELEKMYGVRVYILPFDVRDRKQAAAALESLPEEWKAIDVLVNNAGLTIFESLQDIQEETLDLLINLDFKNYILMMREAANYMIASGTKGNIINITSSRGEQSYPEDGLYGGLKAGLNRAICSFALDVSQYGIRINNVAPGAIRIRTREELIEGGNVAMADFWDELGNRIALGRSGLPEDIGHAVAFLASDKASYITGTTLRVDGGLILPGMPEMITEGLKPGEWRSVAKPVKNKGFSL